jgi:hypothetical protein
MLEPFDGACIGHVHFQKVCEYVIMTDKNGLRIQSCVYWICWNWPLEMYYLAQNFSEWWQAWNKT